MNTDPMNPPAAAPDNRRQMIIAGVVALVVLCCCCATLAVGTYVYACYDTWVGAASSCSF